MRRPLLQLGPLLLGLLVHTSCVVFSATDPTPAEEAFVAVQLPGLEANRPPAERLDPDLRYPAGSRVVLIAADRPAAPRVLSSGLHSAGWPAVAPDGRRILFAGKAQAGSAWSIYETDTRGGVPRELIRSGADCIDPSYIGGGLVAFVCRVDDLPAGSWALHTAAADGSEPRRISFFPGAAADPSPLRDGRILFSMCQQPGIGRERASSALFTVNPDGTLLDAFLGSHEEADLLQARETADGGVVFLVRRAAGPGLRVERAELRQPRLTRRPVDIGLEGVGSVEPLADGGLLVSGERGVWQVGPESGVRRLVAADSRSQLIDAVPVEVGVAPRGRPSPVDLQRSSATLIGYDAARTDGSIVRLPDGVRPARITVEQFDEGPLGTVALESDGSFFLEVPADRAIRVRSSGDDGHEIAVSDWFWLRPGEVRSCFGCHESREAAPINRVIAALRGEPIRVGGEGGPP